MRKLPQVVADGSGSLAKLLADASHGLFAVHPQRSKDPHANRTRHGPKSIGTGHGHCGIFGQLPLVGVRIVHRRRLLSIASHYIQIFVQNIRALISITTYATGNAMIPCSSGKMSILEQEAD